MNESLDDLIENCYRQAPILRAITDAANTDERLEKAWARFVKQINYEVTTRIEAFGRRPRSK